MPPLHDDEQEESLRDTISAAFRADSDKSTGQEDTVSEPSAAEDTESSAGGTDSSASPSDAPDDKDVAKAESPGVEAESDGPDKEKERDAPLDPPARWTKKQKEWFATLDREFQSKLIDNDKNIQADYTRKMQEIGHLL